MTRALLACLVLLLAFEPPAPRVELASPIAAAVASPARAPNVRRVEVPRAAPMRSLATLTTIDERPVAIDAATPREPLLPVRRLYVELCSLLC